MNHASLIEHQGAQLYRDRAYILSVLDQRHFDAFNPAGQVLGLNGYCLDAPDELPAGCMSDFASIPMQYTVQRGQSLEERQEIEALADRLIAEILAEEASTK